MKNNNKAARKENYIMVDDSLKNVKPRIVEAPISNVVTKIEAKSDAPPALGGVNQWKPKHETQKGG